MSELLDTVAEAIHKADITESPWRTWDQLLPEGRDDYRRMAQAAIDALQLTQEWAVYTDRNTRGDIVNVQLNFADQESAQEHALTTVEMFWRKHEGVAGAVIVKPKPEVRSRLVSPWTQTEQ